MALKKRDVVIDYKFQTTGAKKIDQSFNKIDKSSKKANESVKGLGNTLKNLAAGAGIALGAQQLLQFGKEAVTAAAQAEGVKAAFDRLNSPGLLDNLRDATKGTVSDLALMKNAVQAKNLGVPVKQLGTLFEFARRRAKETGESVEFLTQSIVTGIGRKSPLILDNLGLSAAKISEEFKRTGDFGAAVGDIVRDELQNMGEDIDSTAEKIARMNARFENFQVQVGEQLILALEPFFNFLDELEEDRLPALSKLFIETLILPIRGMTQVLDLVVEKINELTGSDFETLGDRMDAFVESVGSIVDELDDSDEKIKEVAGSMNDLGNEVVKQATTLKSLQAELKLLKDTLNETEVGTKKFKDTQEAIIGVEARIATALGKETEAQKKLREEKEKALKLEKERIEAQIKLKDEMDKARRDELAAEKKAVVELEQLTAKSEQERIDAVLSARDLRLEGVKKGSQQEVLIREQAEQEILKIQQESIDKQQEKDKERVEALREAAFTVVESMQEVLGAIADAQNQQLELAAQNAELLAQKDIERVERQSQQELMKLKASLQRKEITQKQFNVAVQELDKKSATIRAGIETDLSQRQLELKRKQAKADKAVAVAQAGISAALAIVRALTIPPPAGQIAAAAIGAAAAVQVGIILGTSLPTFAKGVVDLQGPGTETSDSIHARLSKGESVIPAKSTRKHKPIVRALVEDKLDKYMMEDYIPSMIQNGNIAQSLVNNVNVQKFTDKRIREAINASKMQSVINTERIIKTMEDSDDVRPKMKF